MRALITGASSGIGRALAHRLAREGHELLLVARGADPLKRLVSELPGGSHEFMPADLSAGEGVDAVCERLQDESHPIDLLVHSAGIGLPPGGYLGSPLEATERLNRVTVDALASLAHAALPGMLRRRRGGIIVIGSIAGFLPGTPAITYSAAKAWAQAFSEGLSCLTRGSGVRSTVVTPGFVRSGFHASAGLAASGIHDVMWTTPEAVAAAALRGYERGRALVIPGAVWKCVYALYRLAPRSWSRAWFSSYMAWMAKREQK